MDSYQKLLKYVLEYGEEHDDRTGVGTLSVFGHQWRHDVGNDGFPLMTSKRMPLRIVAEELFWFLRGSSNAKELQERNVRIWDEWATEEQCAKFGRQEGDLGPIYGPMWRTYPGYGGPVDQIAELICDITDTPNSRRLIVNAWHPYYAKHVTLPPCHTLWQVKCHEKSRRLDIHLYARSIDAFLGGPFDIASYALLMIMIAKVTGYSPGDLIVSFGDLHIYKNHIDAVKEQLSRGPYPLPTVVWHGNCLSTAKWDDIELLNYSHHPTIKAPVAV